MARSRDRAVASPDTETEAEREWRDALLRAGYPMARGPGPVHPVTLLHPGGDRDAAERAYLDFLDQEPKHRMGLEGLSYLYQISGRTTAAVPLRRRLAALAIDDLGIADEDREEGIQFLLAREGVSSTPDRVPSSYLSAHFDRYVDWYDEHLRDILEYRGPEEIQRALKVAIGESARALAVLDAGCGTGLLADVLRPLARELVGVDLSPGMIAKARDRDQYDSLETTDLVTFMETHVECYDLIAAGDVLNYFGDLRPVFAGATGALRPGGVFVFTAERGSDAERHLSATGRYTHDIGYLRAEVALARLELVQSEEVELRLESQRPVVAHLFVVRKPDHREEES
jgi:predicted TPR repeat methyltransferase